MQHRTTSDVAGDWDTYYYEKNLQGDVIAIYNASGTKLVSYTYDAWGNFTRTDVASSVPDVVKNNPITYRGYYYDHDLDLYYLTTRYYDPETYRFVTADDPAYLGANGDLISYNLYAYCSNNPVMYVDPTGHSITAAIIIGIIAGITIAFAATAYTDYVDDGEVFNGSVDAVDYAANMVVGGTVGGLVGYASPAIGAFLTTNFTFGAPALVVGGEAVAVTVSGAQIIGSVTLAGVVINAVSTKNSNGYWGQKYSNDHSPEHIHLKGPNTNIRIGIDGNPLKGEPTLNPQQRKALKKLWKEFANLFEKP